MDGSSFDRLAAAVHRLQSGTTRRGVLRTIVAGGVAGLLGRLGAGEAGAARDRRGRRCRSIGGRCSADRDCCSRLECGTGGRCFPANNGGNNGGGRRCGVTACRLGWNCCRTSGSGSCYDPDHLHCCRSTICPTGWDCCGTGHCCSAGSKCCGNGRCCPDNWQCGATACFFRQSSDATAAATRTVPFSDPVAADVEDWIKRGWMTAESEDDGA